MKIQYFLVAAAVVMMTGPVFAQPQTSVEIKKGTDKTTVTGTATVIATVVAIDPATRTVTLKDKNGRVEKLEAGEEVRNFDQLKVGDVVTTEYREARSLSLRKTSGPRSATERQIVHPAAAGTEPGGTISREVTVVGDVVAVDAKGTHVTIKGPQGTMDVLVDPEQLKNIRQGDQVEIVHTEAVAISVTPGTSE
jgi:ribosomal protein L6P/L9E